MINLIKSSKELDVQNVNIMNTLLIVYLINKNKSSYYVYRSYWS